MLSKPSAINVPLIAVAIDVLLLGRGWRRALPLPLAWAVLGAVFIQITSRFHQSVYVDSPLGWRPLVALDAIGFYLAKLLAPLWLTPDYGRRPQWVIAHAGQALASAAFACAAMIGAIVLWRRGWREWRGRGGRGDSNLSISLAAATSVFLLALVPFLGLKPLLFQWYSTVADRYAYIALLGAAIAGAAIVHARRGLLVPALAMVLTLAVVAAINAGRWRDSRTLFTYAHELHPRGLMTNSVLADDAVERGDDAAAQRYFTAAMEARPDDPTSACKFGRWLLDRGRYQQASQCLVRAMFCAPDNPAIHTDLSVALLHLGKVPEAEAELRNAISLAQRAGKPSGEAWQNLGVIYAHTGRPADATRAFEQALAINPSLSLARQQLDALRSATAGTDPAAR
jgi:predicted Zn-dependent protease